MIIKSDNLESISPAVEQAAEKSCTACGSNHLTDIFHAKNQPINVGVTWDSAEEARSAPKADITLSYCQNCELVFNRIFDLEKVEFSPGYEVALKHSPIFNEFINSVIARLIIKYDLNHKTILEIGCGGGDFIRSICEAGNNRGIGIDPTVLITGIEKNKASEIEFIRDFFGPKYKGLQSDFICCLSVFEDIPKPLRFLHDVRQMIGDRLDTPLYFEVFNAYRAIAEKENWSIHYEQCNYFSQKTLTNLFAQSGFAITEAGTCYQDGQYLYVEAMPDAEDVRTKDSSNRHNLPNEIAEFSKVHEDKISYWTAKMKEFQQNKQKVVIWGTGGKGVSFLNSVDTQGVIQYALEINPDKQGKFVPGSGQQIVSPDFLTEYQPDKVIITNALYKQEMQQQATELGVTAEFMVA